MILHSLKVELRWTRILLGTMFILCVFGYKSSNDDYSRFLKFKDNLDYKIQNSLDNIRYESEILHFYNYPMLRVNFIDDIDYY